MTEEDEGKGGELRFGVNARAYSYLGWLVKNTTLGRTENEVAKQVLADTLSKMSGESYRDRT
jgi:hypothetical protein